MSFALSEPQLVAIDDALAAGARLEEALGDAVSTRRLPSGALVMSETEAADRETVAAALRLLAQVTGEAQRSVAVLGEFDSTEADALEEHDYIGRLVVRLNVAQLVAVGHAARHIQSAAGLEGSWDGESLIVGTPEEAYDLLRGQLHGNDIVLVMASARAGLGRLIELLEETDR